MSIKKKVLQAWVWIQDPVTQGRLFLLACSLVVFCLVARFGYVDRPRIGSVCAINDRAFICRLLFFCTFVTMVTCLVFLGLGPYLPSIQVIHYLRVICLIDLVTAGLWLFIWAFGSFLLLEQWVQTDPGPHNVHSCRSIVAIAFGGAACWVMMVMLLTKRLKEVNAMEGTQNVRGSAAVRAADSDVQPRHKALTTGPMNVHTPSV
ncbi:synaptogyrin-4-like [Scyliorhinus torazame]|uniref:synaptogyrin-4-like n=1 Tax=Scyliorhinus torazame TaxID=75743 RepID=UPI003B5B617E